MTPQELRTNAAVRLQDAEVLFNSGRYDAATYLCGYAVELSLKAKICDTLNWPNYPPAQNFFFKGFKIHDLDVLLLLTGHDAVIKQNYLSERSIVKTTWNPEMRYLPAGRVSLPGAADFLKAARVLLQQL